jgi:NADH-quinone oxidoreductase subunit A
VVFGKLNQLRSPAFGPILERTTSDSAWQLTPAAKEKFGELGIPAASVQQIEKNAAEKQSVVIDSKGVIDADLRDLSLMTMLDLGVFFIVLLVGFAYLWKQGDLNWVRAIARPAQENNKLSLLRQYGEGQ